MNITEKQIRIIRLVSDILISAMLTVTGVLFAVSCCRIYTSAQTAMFTYASIGKAYGKIAPAVYVTLALIIIGAVLSIVFPRAEKKLAAPHRSKKICTVLQRKVDISAVNSEEKAKILSERRLRRGLIIANIAVILFEAFLPLIYLFNPDTFPAKDNNSEVLRAFLIYLCMLIPLLVYETVCFIITRLSYARESELLKAAMKSGAVSKNAVDTESCKARKFCSDNEEPIILGVRIAMLAASFIFIIIGITNGGMADVLIKAVNICAECIGLG